MWQAAISTLARQTTFGRRDQKKSQRLSAYSSITTQCIFSSPHPAALYLQKTQEIVRVIKAKLAAKVLTA
jgi:hypothetical protein